MDSLFRTKKTADKTYIGGSSLGGLFSFYASLKHPEIFGKAVVFSPSFWYSEDIFSYVESIESEDIEDLQFYFRAGEKENETMLPLMLKMKELLSSKLASDTQINIDSIPDGEHNEKLWAKSFPDAALWLLDLDQ